MVIFRFKGVDGANTEYADKIIEEITDATEDWQIEYDANAVWVEDAILYETDTDNQLEVHSSSPRKAVWDEFWINQKKESDNQLEVWDEFWIDQKKETDK